MPILGKQYSGAKVTRDALENFESDNENSEEISEGSKNEDSDGEEAFAGYDDDDEAESTGSAPDSDASSGEDDVSRASSYSNEDDEDGFVAPVRNPSMQLKPLSNADRAAMREMMASEHSAVAASISQAAKDDIEKGRAVKHQRDTYNSHLNTRIRLQKALVQANSLPHVLKEISDQEPSEALKAAETAALNLLNTISSMQDYLSSTKPSASERKRSFTAAFSTPSLDIQSQLSEVYASAIDRHRAVLSKWSHKTQLSSGRPQQDKFGASAVQSLTAVLDSHLTGPSFEKHIARTHVPRSCAPAQVAAGVAEDDDIYDDADFYALLLQEFVEARSAAAIGSGAADLDIDVAALRRANRTKRKDVDTKASKGRKLTYTVHEKLQNFMAPRDIGTWGERQANELFASLLGRRVKGGLGERDEDEEDYEDENGVDREMEGLRLFGGTA